MTTQPVVEQHAQRDPAVKLLTALVVGGAVALALGVYSNVHDPTAEQPYTLVFTGTIQLKVWFATAAVVLACVQVLLGARLFDKIHVPRHAPPWLGDAHRLTGTVTFVLTLPVAYHCLWGLGFQSTDTRVLVHSILGCVFYGAFVTKVMAVRMRGLPDRTLPLVGGFVFAVLVGIWLTSSLWFFTSGSAPPPLF